MQNERTKCYGITPIAFSTGKHNVSGVDFNPNKFLYINKVQPLSFPIMSISTLH